MTEVDYTRFSKIRPGLTRLEAEELLGKPTQGCVAGAPGISLLFGRTQEWNPDGKDKSDILEIITFRDDFPPKIDLYGLRMGMNIDQASVAFGTLKLTQGPTFPKAQQFEGWTPDNFRVLIGFESEQGAPVSDMWRLRRIELSYPYADEYIERQTALRQELVEQEKQNRKRANAWKDIKDDDDGMLMDWAAHCKPWDDYSESQFIAYAKWLKRASPDERHMAACCWNWDYGLAPLIWIIRQPDCDIATALAVYFGCEPSYYLKFYGDRSQVPSINLEGFDFLTELKDRIETGYYKRSKIAFESRKALDIILRYEPTKEQIEATIPSNIKDYYDGRVCNERNLYGGLQMPDFGIN